LDDLVGYNARDKRIYFPVNRFSFKYDGPFKNLYAFHIYAPSGHRIEFGDPKEQREKGDHGRVGLAFDKEVLLQCLLEEVQAYSVDVFPGVNVEKVTTLDDGLRVEGSRQSFEGAYVIAADGVNSRVAQVMGFNKDRTYYCNVYGLSYYMSGMEPPEPDVNIAIRGFLDGRGVTFFILPRAVEGEYIILISTVDPRVNLEAAGDYFMQMEFCASWFKNAQKLRTLSSVCNCYSPIIEPFKDRVLVAGDVGSTRELEITGAMIGGWRAGQAISTVVSERNMGLETTGILDYVKWWQDAYINSCDYENFLKGAYGQGYILSTDEETSYMIGLFKETLSPCWHPYKSPMPEAMAKVISIMQRERPEILQKLQRRNLPASQLFAEVARISEPVS
jgi:flavin-dependent dehydrogenase